jgi:hypothetical protein
MDIGPIGFISWNCFRIHVPSMVFELGLAELGEVVRWAIEIRSHVFFEAGNGGKIQLDNFSDPAPQPNITIPPAPLPRLRYLEVCAKSGQELDSRTGESFMKFEGTNRTIIAFDSDMASPVNANIIAFPLLYLRRSIQFVISSALRSLVLMGADMRSVLRDIDWPPEICNIEFVDCRFSS